MKGDANRRALLSGILADRGPGAPRAAGAWRRAVGLPVGFSTHREQGRFSEADRRCARGPSGGRGALGRLATGGGGPEIKSQLEKKCDGQVVGFWSAREGKRWKIPSRGLVEKSHAQLQTLFGDMQPATDPRQLGSPVIS